MLVTDARSLDATEGQRVAAVVNLVDPRDAGVDILAIVEADLGYIPAGWYLL